MKQTLARCAVAETRGTSLMLTAVVGSGIMAERLAGANVALALLANTFATGAALLALILTFGPVSGAHFNPIVANPAVTVARALSDTFTGTAPGNVLGFVVAQIAGGVAATLLFQWFAPTAEDLEANQSEAS